jgi:periplasmic protein TonB
MQLDIEQIMDTQRQSTAQPSNVSGFDVAYQAMLKKRRPMEATENLAALGMMPQLHEAKSGISSTLSFILVLLAHAMTIYFLSQKTTAVLTKPTAAAPMVVSLIAPPSPEPELLPVIEPPKPIVEPKPKLKQIVEKIIPTETPTERLVEATTEQIKEETPTPQAAPVLEPALAKSPPAQKVVEDIIEPPRFGVSYLNNPAPDYPSMSRRLGEEGRVLMKVLVSAEGSAEDVQIEKTSGSERLDNAAVNAVKRWRFIPAKKNNQPLSAFVLVPMKFSLDS